MQPVSLISFAVRYLPALAAMLTAYAHLQELAPRDKIWVVVFTVSACWLAGYAVWLIAKATD